MNGKAALRRPRQDESGHDSGHAAPDRDDRRREELVARALDERVPQRMKGRRAKDGGQDAGTEVSRVGHERVTVMDSLVPVEPRGDAADRQRARAEARASFARVGARTEPAAAVRDRGLALALSALVEPLRSGDRQHRRRRRGRRFLFRQPDAERRRRGRGDHAFGGTDLSQRRPGGLHRDPARSRAARAALLAASGDADVRGRAARAAARGRDVRRG